MKYIAFVITFLFSSIVFAQNFYELEVPTETGNEIYLLLTKTGGEKVEEIPDLRIALINAENEIRRLEELLTLGMQTTLQNEKRIQRLENANAPPEKLSETEEYTWILQNITSKSKLNSTYNKSNQKKRGYSIVDIAKFQEINVETKKANGKLDTKPNIVNRIWEKLQESKKRKR